MIETRIITSEHKNDINIKNEPFTVYGRLIPSLENGVWSFSRKTFKDSFEMRFPDEKYDFENMSGSSVFIGAYDGEKCVGLSVLQRAFFKYMYLYDLKVNAEYRRKGVGEALIRASMQEARKRGYNGLYAVCQDNNLAACDFYLKCGFRIGGADTEVYKGTPQKGKTDILFYLG